MTREARAAAIVACCMLGAAAASWARVLAFGDLSATGVPALVWPNAIVGVLGGIAGLVCLRLALRRELAWSTLLIGAIAIHCAASLALPLTSNDVWGNVAYGRLAAHGINPFLASPAELPITDHVRALVDVRWVGLLFPYGPVIATLGWLAARTGTVVGDLVVFKLLILATALATTVIAAKVCKARFPEHEAKARFLLFAWCPLLAWEISGQAHNDGVLILALLGFVWAATSERPLIAICCLAAGVASKFVAAPVAGLYLVFIARKRPLLALGLAAALAGLCAALFVPWWHGPGTFAGVWNQMAPGTIRTSRSIADLLYWSAQPLGPAAQRLVYQGMSLGGLAVSAAVGLIGIVRARSLGAVIHYALLFYLCGDLLALGWFQPWYVLWALPLALVHPDRRWLDLTALYAALSLVAYVLPIDPVLNVAIDLYIGWRLVSLLRSPPAPAALS